MIHYEIFQDNDRIEPLEYDNKDENWKIKLKVQLTTNLFKSQKTY